MRRALIKTIMLIIGIVFLIWGLHPLLLLAFGSRTDGVITEVMHSNLHTEMKGGRWSGTNKSTGFFSVKTKIRYRFDVRATPLEELQRLSEAPIAVDVTGLGTLHGKTKFPDIPLYDKGDSLQVIFLKPLPSFNAAYQPNWMLVLGILRLLGGSAFFVWIFLISSARKKENKSLVAS